MHVWCCLDVDRDAVGAGPRDLGHVPLGPLDHQVDVQDPARPVDLVGDGRDDQRTEGDWRHEVAVHDVDVDDPGAGRHHLLNLGAQTREIGRQDRWSDPPLAQQA